MDNTKILEELLIMIFMDFSTEQIISVTENNDLIKEFFSNIYTAIDDFTLLESNE